MKETAYIVVLITTETDEEAQQISALLLEKKLAACVNIVPGVKSLFRWENKVESAQESLLVVKSRQDRLPLIIDMVKTNHSAAVPEIIALPVIGGHRDYLDWIDESLG
ncbi:divalent-cation tolerance protein CutA [Chloroflexota bacterium]